MHNSLIDVMLHKVNRSAAALRIFIEKKSEICIWYASNMIDSQYVWYVREFCLQRVKQVICVKIGMIGSKYVETKSDR